MKFIQKPDIQTQEKLKFQKRWNRRNDMKQTLIRSRGLKIKKQYLAFWPSIISNLLVLLFGFYFKL